MSYKNLVEENTFLVLMSIWSLHYMVCALLSYAYHVTYYVMWLCDFLSCDCDYVTLVIVTNFIWSYLCQFFDDSHSLKASLKPLRRPFDRCQSCLKAINNGRDIKQINW